MKTSTVIFTLALAFRVTSAPGSADTLSLDGTWWQSLPRDEQLVAVQGMIAGYRSGYLFGQLDASQTVPRRLPTSAKASRFTLSTIANRITEVYLEHPKTMNVEVSTFFFCAAYSEEGCAKDATVFDKSL